MIKSLTILVLMLALAIGSFLSCPRAADFKTFVTKRMEAKSNNLFGRAWADMQADSYYKSCTINDRGLYLSIQHDGKTVYTGAFNHFFGNDPTLSR